MTSTRFFSVSVLVAKLAKNNSFQMGTFYNQFVSIQTPNTPDVHSRKFSLFLTVSSKSIDTYLSTKRLINLFLTDMNPD